MNCRQDVLALWQVAVRKAMKHRLIVCALSLMAAASVTASQSPRAQVQQPPATLHGADALERLKQNSQYDSLQAALHQARFSVSRVAHSPLGEAAWHAPNPAAGYDAYVTESGVSIALASQSIASLSLHSVGYGNALQTVTSGTISGDKQTITIERDGIREWFLNGAEGLEHGFTLSQAPRARQADALLRLALQVSENWRAVASANGGQVTLHDRAGTEVIEYGKLTAYDAVGRKLAAQLTVADAQVIIEVDDRAAQYPLTIDPLFTLQKQLLANDSAADDLLGHAVALDGDTALIGAPYDDVMEQDQGSAYVFVRNGETWTQQARLVANDGANLDLFGWAVALDGDTALIGAYNGPGTASTDQGAAYVFVRNGTVWTQQKRLNASDGVMAGLYATALAISGDTALVGAPDFRTNANFAPGTVYVYVRNGTDWTQQTKLFASDIGNNDRFGSAIALQGNTALIGAPSNAVTVLNQGAAYIFVRNGSSWTQQMPILTAGTDAHVDDAFGNAVALNGGKALIGTPGYGNDDSGKVYLFQHGASGWALTDSLRPPNPTPSEAFGMSVAMNGSTTVIGASLRLFAPGIDHRSAYVYLYAGEFFLLRHLGPDLGSAEDRFGYAVAVDGNTVLVGAYRANITAVDQGAAYVFTVHDSLHHEQQKLFAPDGKAQEVFGDAVALDADTLAIGADEALVNNQSLRGAVYIFVRSGTTWTFQQKIVAPDGAASDQFGQAVALDGNTLAVGAYKDDIGGNQDQGSVYVFTRSGTSWTFQQKLTAAGIDGLPLDKLGTAVALRDQTLLAGAPGYSGGRGTVFVFTRNGTLWQEQLKLSANDAAAGDAFGSAVAFRGEMAIIGAPADDNGTKIDQGSAYIFARNGTNWAFQQKLLANDGAADDYFGGAVAIKGDTVAVGAPLANIGTQGDQGAAYVFTRQNAAWTQSPKLLANDGSQGYHFGQSVALDDGILAVGAPLDNQARGAAYIYTGLGTLWAFQQKLLGSDTTRNDYLGSSVAVAGDTIAVGASGDDFSDGVNKGSTYVFVSPHCPIITLGPDSLPDGLPGIAYDYQLTATGSVAGDYVFSLSYGTLPSGLTLDIPGRLHGTPSAPGTYHFTITATFALSGCTTRRNYTITIAPCPAITLTPPSLPNGVVGAAYDQTLTASANGSSLSSFIFAVTAGALPPGLSLNPTGNLSGTPAQAGSYNFTITATSSGCTATQNYTLTILATCPTLTVAPPLLPNGRIGVAYNQTLTVTGGTAPYTFALKVGSTIPPGLSFVNGTLSGTPTQTGTYGFQTRIKDANNCEVTQGYSVTINPPCEPVVINPPTLPNATVGMAYSQTLTVSVTALGVNFVVSAGALPPGLTLAANGNLSGQPTQGGNYDFTVTATANGCTGTRAYTLSVTGNGGLQFYPLAKPIRLLDTRGGQGNCDNVNAPIAAGGSITTLARTTCEGITIPAAAQAIVGNITVINQSAQAGFLTLYPTGVTLPLAANMIYGPNGILANNFTVGLSANGEFNIFGERTIDVIVDVSGYFAPPGAGGLYYHPLSKPIRLTDTRPAQGNCDSVSTPIAAGTSLTTLARTTCEGLTIPAAAQAIVGNATVINQSGQTGYLTIYPDGVAAPLAANMVYFPGNILSNAFTVGLSATGRFNIFGEKTIDMIVDVAGYYSTEANDANGVGLLFNPLSRPLRILDTRAAQGNCDSVAAPITGGTSIAAPARLTCESLTIPATAQTVLGNVTVINQTAQAGFLTLYPDGVNLPLAANMIYFPGQVLSNAFVVGLNAGTGQYRIFAERTLDAIVDVSGYFAP